MNIHSVPTETTMTTRVLDAALAVFTERTYGGSTVPQVAERAGVGVGTIYRSFVGKEALANGVFRRAKESMLEHLLEALAEAGPDASPRSRVAAVWSGLAAYAASDPDGFAFLEHQQHAAYLDDESATLVALVFGAFVGLSKQRRALGRPLSTTDLDAAGDAVWHLVARPVTTTSKEAS